MNEWILFYLSALETLSELIPGPPYASTIAAVAGRLAYVGYIWVRLSRQLKLHSLPRDYRQKAYRDFRRTVMILMNLDAVLFIIATVKNSNEIPDHQPLLLSAGIVLVLVGILSKIAAIKVLGSRGYYWGDFFYQKTTPYSYERASIGTLRIRCATSVICTPTDSLSSVYRGPDWR